MSNKYDVRICKCGRIHMVDNNKLEKLLESNKNLLLICGSCGSAKLIGADIEPDINDPGKNCYMMYSSDFSYKDKSIVASDFESSENYKGIGEIIYSHGLGVPMMTGMYATNYYNGIFSDITHPDFYEIHKKDITVKEIIDYIDKYNHDRRTVDMNMFINETPKDILEELSHYYIEGLIWNGTKYETDWNTK